jgi:DNA polymerase-4
MQKTHWFSAEDTFERDVSLPETEPMIRRLAEKVWAASRKESRIPRTVVLKLKTSEFNILRRSHTPQSPPSSCQELTAIALGLRDRVQLRPERLFRLVGVGLSNFHEPEDRHPQQFLFATRDSEGWCRPSVTQLNHQSLFRSGRLEHDSIFDTQKAF